MPLLKKVQGGYILHTEKRFFDLDSMKKMQKTRRKWHETKVFSFGSVCLILKTPSVERIWHFSILPCRWCVLIRI